MMACPYCADLGWVDDEKCSCQREPTDDEIYNGFGMEGGIPYEPTTPPSRKQGPLDA